MEGRVQYERNVLRGIRDFASENTNWLIRFEMPGEQVGGMLEDWKPDGILFQAKGLSVEVLSGLADNPRAIHLSESPKEPALRGVGLNNEKIGADAADYLLSLGFRHFAFVGQEKSGFSRKRGAAFRKQISEEGHSIAVFNLDGGLGERELSDWLIRLPRPCGLFATHDECGIYLSTLCQTADIKIPEEIAILGVDNDTLICEVAWPQLSSIAVPSRRVGWEAAKRLDRWLGGGQDKGELLLPPAGIVTRQSTFVARTEDEALNRALRYMHANFSSRINIGDVLRETAISRRLLERKFRQHLGRSPLEELRRLRIDEVARLLCETRLPLHEIAPLTGFRDANQLVRSFKAAKGLTPGEFRKIRES